LAQIRLETGIEIRFSRTENAERPSPLIATVSEFSAHVREIRFSSFSARVRLTNSLDDNRPNVFGLVGLAFDSP